MLLVLIANPALLATPRPVGFRVPADPQGSNSGVHAEITPPAYPRLVAFQGSKLHEEKHKGHEIYTGSGHHCGVIPYSSLWCGGFPQGLMMNSTLIVVQYPTPVCNTLLARGCSWLVR